MKKQVKNKKVKAAIILLSVLLAVSIAALAAVLIHNRRSAVKPAAATVPDNLITSETDVTSDTPVSSESAAQENKTVTAESKKEKENSVTLRLYKRNAQDNEPFNVQNMLPGDSETKYFRVRVSHNGAVTVKFHADIRHGYEKLAEVLKVKVTLLTTGEEMYDGLMRDMPASVAHTLNSQNDAEDELYYKITAYLDTSVGNDYQYKSLIADFRWQVEEEGNLIPPKTGDNSAIVPWAVAAAVSGLFIVILIVRRRKEENENA